MRDEWIPKTPEQYVEYLVSLRSKREDRKRTHRTQLDKREILTKNERSEIFRKTDGKCHICGGDIKDKWEADHVLARSGGGRRNVHNYLPAHKLCNNYRWDYLPEEFQEILKLGVWLRTQIQRRSNVGKVAVNKFLDYEKKRISRRRKSLQKVTP